MKIVKDRGIITKHLSNNQGEYVLELRSCCAYNNDFSYAKLNGVELFRTTSAGFTLVRFDSNMNFVGRTTVANNASAESNIIQWFNTLSIGDKFAIITHYMHIFIPYITNNLGAVHFNKFNRGHHLGNYIPWVAYGVKENNIAYITHETFGSATTGFSNPHAILNISVSRDNSLTNYSSGGEYNYSLQQTLVNNTVGAKSGSIPIRNRQFNGRIEFVFNGQMDNKSNPDSRICEFSIYKNNVNQGTIIIDSDIKKTYKTIIQANANDNIEIRYFIPSNAFCSFDYIGAHFKRYFVSDTNIAKTRATKESFITKSFRTSMIPCNPRNISEVVATSPTVVFETDGLRFLDNNLFNTTNINNTTKTSNFIEVDNTISYAFLMYIKSTLINGSNITFRLSCYDENFGQVQFYRNQSLVNQVTYSNSIVFKTKLLSIPIYSSDSTSTDLYHLGELELIQNKYYIRLTSNVKYIQCTIEGNYAHCYASIQPIVVGIKNDGTTFGGLNIQA